MASKPMKILICVSSNQDNVDAKILYDCNKTDVKIAQKLEHAVINHLINVKQEPVSIGYAKYRGDSKTDDSNRES